MEYRVLTEDQLSARGWYWARGGHFPTMLHPNLNVGISGCKWAALATAIKLSSEIWTKNRKSDLLHTNFISLDSDGPHVNWVVPKTAVQYRDNPGERWRDLIPLNEQELKYREGAFECTTCWLPHHKEEAAVHITGELSEPVKTQCRTCFDRDVEDSKREAGVPHYFTCASCNNETHSIHEAKIAVDPNARMWAGEQPRFCKTCYDISKDDEVIGLDTPHTFEPKTMSHPNNEAVYGKSVVDHLFPLPLGHARNGHWYAVDPACSHDRCSCDIKVLMDYGCQCGNAQKELAAERGRRNDG